MDIWTPRDRDEFVQFATYSEDGRGSKGPYHFSSFPRVLANDKDDPRKTFLTETLAKTIYDKNPYYRKISLGFYDSLIHKLSMNSFTGPYVGNNIIVVMKGSNAYTYVTSEKFKDDFHFSDMDLVVCINPNLPDDFFHQLECAVKTLVLQTISQYKRTLDYMFFLTNKSVEASMLDDETIKAFKIDYSNALKDLSNNEYEFVSPFESDEIRNYCSRNSCLLTNSKIKDVTIVRVELPHYERCERIPLRKTPFFCSYNETIDFSRCEGESHTSENAQGHFDLYRIRFNNLILQKDKDGQVIHKERIAADFIDVSIARKDDAELIDFWNRGKCISIYDRFANIWIMVPDIVSCINDLYKMLNVYSCTETKKAKRQQKYNRLVEIHNQGVF